MTHMRTMMLELIGHLIILCCMIPMKNVSRALKDQMALKTDGTQPLNVIKKDLIQLNFTFLLEQPLFFVLQKQQSKLVHSIFQNIQTLLQAAPLFLKLRKNQLHLLYKNKLPLIHKKWIYKNKFLRKKKKLKRRKNKEKNKRKKKLKLSLGV